MEAEGLSATSAATLYSGAAAATPRAFCARHARSSPRTRAPSMFVMAPGGGFVFQQVHNIMSNVSAENILAMYAAVSDAEIPAESSRGETFA